MVFQGQCEIYKTKNEFKIYDENGEEINQANIDSPLKKHKDDVSDIRNTAESPMNSFIGINPNDDRNSPIKSIDSFGN